MCFYSHLGGKTKITIFYNFLTDTESLPLKKYTKIKVQNAQIISWFWKCHSDCVASKISWKGEWLNTSTLGKSWPEEYVIVCLRLENSTKALESKKLFSGTSTHRSQSSRSLGFLDSSCDTMTRTVTAHGRAATKMQVAKLGNSVGGKLRLRKGVSRRLFLMHRRIFPT